MIIINSVEAYLIGTCLGMVCLTIVIVCIIVGMSLAYGMEGVKK